MRKPTLSWLQSQIKIRLHYFREEFNRAVDYMQQSNKRDALSECVKQMDILTAEVESFDKLIKRHYPDEGIVTKTS